MIARLKSERDRYRQALEEIEAFCADDRNDDDAAADEAWRLAITALHPEALALRQEELSK